MGPDDLRNTAGRALLAEDQGSVRLAQTVEAVEYGGTAEVGVRDEVPSASTESVDKLTVHPGETGRGGVGSRDEG
jgi:hypothetical protein